MPFAASSRHWRSRRDSGGTRTGRAFAVHEMRHEEVVERHREQQELAQPFRHRLATRESTGLIVELNAHRMRPWLGSRNEIATPLHTP